MVFAMINPLDPGYHGSDELRRFGFKAVGRNVRISKDCTVIGPENIVLGDDIRIDSATCIVATTGVLTLGGQNHIGGQCHFCVAADLTIGEFAGVSQGVRIYTASDDYSGAWLMGPMVPSELRGGQCEAIRLERHTTVGAGTVILPGCHISEGTVVGALSLVTHPTACWSVYHGNPARRIRARKRDVEHLERMLKARLTRSE